MKKIITVLLAVIIMFAGMGTVVADTTPARQPNDSSGFTKTRAYDNAFTDINGHWAAEYISNAYEYGIINGIGGGLYDPEGRLTVTQAAIMAARLHGSDVGEWRGDSPVTRAEAIRIWSNILQPKDMARLNTVNNLPDVNLSTPYFTDIVLFYEAGIVQGSTINGQQNCFNPDGTLSRAEAAAIFMLMAEKDKRISGKTYGEKTVSTFAGTGTSGFSDGKITTASFTLPYGLAADINGGIIVFDTYNNALRLINNGKIETIAGKWVIDGDNRFSKGFYRDGSLAEALFNRPAGGVINAGGDLFICDSENHVIRLIKDGKVSTYAGTTQGYKDGAGSAAKFNTPMAIAIDKSGNLYVADTMNNCVRKIDVNGNVTTVASAFLNPMGIAVNDDGSVIYVADTGNHSIRKIEDGSVTTLCGVTAETDADGDPFGGYQDGAAGEAMFDLPKGIALAEGILFVADSGNNVIRAVNTNGQVFTVAGTGAPGDREGGVLTAEFNQPAGLLWREGVLYIADTSNNMIKTLTVDITVFKEAK